MTRGTVTEGLVHALVTDSHSEGVVDLYVSAAVEYRGQALLVASGGDELDTSYEFPSTAVLPGEHVLDALCRCLAGLDLTVAQFTGYLGHRDGSDGARVFCFAVTTTDPDAICRSARIGHEWVDLDDSDRFPSSARPHLLELSTRPPVP
ncbi:MAG: NUDIX hydrolase [Acidimicrobiales bacterium]